MINIYAIYSCKIKIVVLLYLIQPNNQADSYTLRYHCYIR